MRWFGRKPEQRASPENPSTSLANPAKWLIDLFGGGRTPAGVSITPETALEVAAVYACVNNISNTVASLPLKVYEGHGDDRRVATDHPLYRMLHDAPVPLRAVDGAGAGIPPVTSYNWRRQAWFRLLRRGRHLTLIRRDRADRVAALQPLPAVSIVAETRAGALRYVVQTAGSSRRAVYEPYEVIDFTAMQDDDGLTVHAPVQRCRNAIGLSKALEEYGARFFANDARPGLVVEMPGRLTDQGQRRLKESIEERHQGVGNSHKVIVLEDGVKIHEVGVQPEHAQFLESRRFQLEEIFRIFNLPPTMAQDLSRGTYSNTEQGDLAYAKHTIGPHVVMGEQELNLKLFSDSDYYAELTFDGLVRADIKTRMEAYAKAIQSAVMVPNEARARENLPSKPGGDDLVIQQNMTPIGRLGEQSSTVQNEGSDAAQ